LKIVNRTRESKMDRGFCLMLEPKIIIFTQPG